MSPSRHVRRLFSLLLAGLWITSASFAEHVSAEFPFCQPDHSPCCPLPVNYAPGPCPACQVNLTVSEREESKSEEVRFTALSESVPLSRPDPQIRVAPKELTPGLRYHPAVFQLKDDLRV